ncbi:hypothetical protein SAMN05880501_11682 [Ureibacillus xyleni]|uniref:Uncharacterized protein n=1 Tax=Ureibacillus xyleni TaxID=614648 RepID=A0A285TN92_9BACL|nr:hypothetical protein [Ureibacillus xyleni]SOC24051.1 hypothetical protein SAMN05880501_11682 [Ureibacillus xyleni]
MDKTTLEELIRNFNEETGKSEFYTVELIRFYKGKYETDPDTGSNITFAQILSRNATELGVTKVMDNCSVTIDGENTTSAKWRINLV